MIGCKSGMTDSGVVTVVYTISGGGTITAGNHTVSSNTNCTITTTGIDTTGNSSITIHVSNFFYGSSLFVVSDNKGNGAPTLLQGDTGSPAAGIATFIYLSPTVGTGHTFTLSVTGGGSGGQCTMGVVGWNNTTTVDLTPTPPTAVVATSISTGSFTPTVANELVLSMEGDVDTSVAVPTGTGSFTTIISSVGSSGINGLFVAYNVQTAATAENITWTGSNSAARATHAVTVK